MLIDDIVALPTIENIVDGAAWSRFRARLSQAVKFTLAPDFAAAAESLAANYDVIANAVPFCRLPFRECWIELAQQHRPRFSTAGIHIPEIQAVPHRVGFLLTADDDKLASFKAHQFWIIKDKPVPFASHMAMSFDPTAMKDAVAISADRDEKTFFKIEASPEWKHASPMARGALNAMVRPNLPDYISMMGATSVLGSDKERDRFGQFIFEIGAADWSGESIYLLAVLALLNTVNASETKSVDNSGVNRHRIKKGIHPLANHYVLTISTRLKARVPKEGAGGYHELRGHLVKGHWKVRKSGIYFWRPFVRGNPQDMIDKSYKVTT